MAAYLLARVTVKDKERFQEYLKLSPGIIQKHGGRYLARGGEKSTVEGPEEARRIVLVEFPSMEAALGFYNSPEYQEARKVRAPAADAQFVILDGLPPA